MLLNLQPLGEPIDLGLRQAAEVRGIGSALDIARTRQDMIESQRRLEELVTEGLFFPLQEIPYDFEFHFETREDWTFFLNRPNAGTLDADLQLVELGLSQSDAILVGTEPNVARSYRRCGEP